ncbi:HIRAN domain-containing protein [Massilia phosphatilytica]
MDDCIAIPVIPGIGSFRVDVAGESFYEESFAALCGDRTIEGVRMEVRARLTLQDDNPHDKHAVQVTIQGHPVGHLSRDHARAFRRRVRYGELSAYEVFECGALICGGWDHGPGDVGNFGVRLDLDLREE